MDFLFSQWLHVSSAQLLFTSASPDSCFLCAVFTEPPLWEIVHVTYETLGLLPVLVTMFETCHLDKSFHLDTSLNRSWKKNPTHTLTRCGDLCRERKVCCFPARTGAGLIFSRLPNQIKIKWNLFSPSLVYQGSFMFSSPDTDTILNVPLCATV